MSEKHTPGPWQFMPIRTVKDDGYAQPHPIVTRGSQGGFQVLGLSPDRETADARLIAAAPDLLAACQAVVDVIGVNEFPHTGRQVLAAIAKAAGKR